MNCQKCKGETDVIDSRPIQEGEAVRRRRKCQTCEHRFTTYEEDIDRSEYVQIVVSCDEISRAIRQALKHQKTTVVVRGHPTAQGGPR